MPAIWSSRWSRSWAGELDVLVPPLRRPVDAGDETGAVHASQVAVDECVPRLGALVGAFGQPQEPRGVVLERVPLEVGVLRLRVRLDLAPVAVQDVLPGVDQLSRVSDGGRVDRVGGHGATLLRLAKGDKWADRETALSALSRVT